jgi:tRNA nucleotidyltransferase (CCA-adding enzyme)
MPGCPRGIPAFFRFGGNIMFKNERLTTIFDAIKAAGGTAYYVGGFVRDYFMRRIHNITDVDTKDVDIEVFGIDDLEVLNAVLASFGQTETVGDFAVIKMRVDGLDIDFSLPRRERKTGRGHMAFEIIADPNMTTLEAATRRDFTINAIMVNAHDGEIVDHFEGIHDIQRLRLRPASGRFAEDPLRVLRMFQFVGRFGFDVEWTETVGIVTEDINGEKLEHRTFADMCNELREEYDALKVERVWTEWHKWAMKSMFPGQALQVLDDANWLRTYPELDGLEATPQDPDWHPEGDVWIHTKLVTDAMASIIRREGIADEDTRLILMFAALLHDVGKPSTTEALEERITARGHCEAGMALAESFLRSIGAPKGLIKPVVGLVKEHLAHAMPLDQITMRMVRRLAKRLSDYNTNIKLLVYLIEADVSGRPPKPAHVPATASKILAMADVARITEGPQEKIVTGKILQTLGLTPGPIYGKILSTAYEAQLDGQITNEENGLEWVCSNFADTIA